MNNILEHMKKTHPTLDRQRLFLFFINPKTASTSIYRGPLLDRYVTKRRHGNEYLQLIDTYSIKEINKIFKFTIIRNPYDRIVSAFLFLQKYTKKIDKKISFKEFIKTTFFERGTSFDIHFRPQYITAFFKDNQFVDFIGKFENLHNDWEYIASKIQCDSWLPHYNKSNRKHYSFYYDSESIDIVSRAYSRDFDYFNYQF